MPITEFLDDYEPDLETRRVMGIAFEIARAALRISDPQDRLNQIIARRIIALAKAGDRDPDRMSDGALKNAHALLTTAGLGGDITTRKLSTICPICQRQADDLDAGNFHGTAIQCLIHGEFEFSRSALREEKRRTRDDWETALKRAQRRNNRGQLPRIYATDF